MILTSQGAGGSPRYTDMVQALTKKQLKERNTMRAALHLKAAILPGGKIEIADDALPSGDAAEVSSCGMPLFARIAKKPDCV